MDKSTVDIAQKEAEEAWLKLSILKDAYFKAEKDYFKKSSRFRNFDYELALTDGRLKKVAPSGERKVKKQPELTLEQIRTIAQNLGISINVEEEPDEETVEAIMEEEASNNAT